MQFQASSMRAAAKTLKISHTELYRRINNQEIRADRFKQGNRWVYILCTDPSNTPTSVKASSTKGGGPVGLLSNHENSQPAGSSGDLSPSRHSQARFIDEWIAWREEGIDLSPWSPNYKRDQVAYLKKYFERYDVVTVENLRDWIREVQPTQVTLRQHRHRAVSSYARFLHERKAMLDEDTYYRIVKLFPKKPRNFKHEQKIIHQEDIPRILEAALKAADEMTTSNYNRVLFRTLIMVLTTTGLRANEVATMRLSKIRFHENPEEASAEVLGKGNKWRSIPLPQITQEAILDYLRVRPEGKRLPKGSDTDRLFWVYHPFKKQYTPLSKYTLGDYMRDIRKKVPGIDFTSHSFRHFCITFWSENPNIPLVATQLWAGHSQLTTTQRYQHTRKKDVVKAAYYSDIGTKELFSTKQDKPKANQVQSEDKTGVIDALRYLAKLPAQEREAVLKLVNS